MSHQVKLQKAISKLNVDDSLALKQAFVGDALLERCHNTRINPSAYLSKAFKHPITLLSAMFDTGCVISGSRALDFFIPGSARLDSDWDFYVPGYKESVADMISALSVCGVTWKSEVDAITAALLRDGRVEVSTNVLEALMSWVADSDPDVATELLGGVVYEITLSFKSLRCTLPSARSYTISRGADGKTYVEPPDNPQISSYEDAYESSSGQSFNIMHGSVETSQGIQPVQLIIGCYYQGIRSCLSFIKDFYATHVQCFIGGWCAAHMYYYHASRKQPTLWERSHDSRAVRKAIAKYQDRGYSFRPSESREPTIRRFHDDQTMFLDYGDIYRAFIRKPNFDMVDGWLADRRRNIESIHWVEFERKLSAMYSPLEACARGRASFASEKFGLPLCRLRRLADIVALNTPESDCMRSKSFYSSVRKTIAGTEWTVREAARSGGVYCALHDANPWSWTM
ncbi:hypothetical protein NCS57_00949700 [Fusarium keratoplasticum]|uniref:Uncharacterized protein n=1 Tax=Fusarium keratoplasticum TaxID=1328300 RepID=A0ACC0QRJ5_9HYPO|nr:hypothetical protein NCS57_00949700 [Fusarium keratoplasticum]KAI8663486.1 hypothetical protein NCS57_00949700 [Fusarium keratoplasticum]